MLSSSVFIKATIDENILIFLACRRLIHENKISYVLKLCTPQILLTDLSPKFRDSSSVWTSRIDPKLNIFRTVIKPCIKSV
jgi:hypothetical protein